VDQYVDQYVSLQSGDVEWHLYEQNSGSIFNRVVKIENLKIEHLQMEIEKKDDVKDLSNLHDKSEIT
jgi:hypothetical protein